MTPMTVAIVDEKTLLPALDRAIRDGLCRCFPEETDVFAHTRSWHGSAPSWCVVIRAEEAVIAHVGIVDRTITAGNTPMRVAGIQNVFVLPEFRGTGLCDQVMIAAMREADRCAFDAGLLYCLPRLQHVYARCGWQLLPPTRIVRIDEYGDTLPLPDKNITMFHPLRIRDFPAGGIHLRGNDW